MNEKLKCSGCWIPLHKAFTQVDPSSLAILNPNFACIGYFLGPPHKFLMYINQKENNWIGMKCWKNCWITWFQWDRTWTAVIDFNRHLSAWVCLENRVWYVYVVPYTTVEAIKAFLSPAKLCAIHKSNPLPPHHLHEGLHSLVWKVLQHFKSCLNCKWDTRSIHSLTCFLPRVAERA